MLAVDDEDSLAMLHACEKDGYWEDELERARRAVDIASLREVADAPTIRQLLDVRETEAAAGPFGYPGYFSCIWEWGDISLHEFLDDPDDSPARVADAVEANVTAALNVLHGLMLVHLDVAPNNILRVDATWKLADLDSCQRSGALARRHPINQRWVHPDRREEPVRVRARREVRLGRTRSDPRRAARAEPNSGVAPGVARGEHSRHA
jgi:hypothetical protein